jgi:hypothetical protein
MKYTPLLGADMSGRLGAIIASKNRYGPYFREGTIPVNPQSDRQTAVRTAFMYFTNRWSAVLTQSNRDDWNNYAANVPIIGTNGKSQKITGFAMYIRCSVAKQMADGTPSDYCSPTLSLPASALGVVCSAVASTQLVSVTFTNTEDWAKEANGFLLVHMGLPQLLTRNFFKGPYRYMGKVVGSVTPPTSPQTMTASFHIQVGQKLYFQCRVLRADGRLSNFFWPGSCIST